MDLIHQSFVLLVCSQMSLKDLLLTDTVMMLFRVVSIQVI